MDASAPDAEQAASTARMPSHANLPTIRSVLLVDDSAAQRAYAVALCHELGIPEVREASNGQEALALLAALTTPPDLLIIDSIQTVFSANVQSAPGSVSQVRECTAKLMVTAKTGLHITSSCGERP